MEVGDVRYFARAADFRRWLKTQHARAEPQWVGFWKLDSGQPSISWPESVDEALCVGWIDGVRKRLDDQRYVIRFSPRRAGSIWSAVNIKRFGELQAAGRVLPAGETAFANRREDKSRVYAFEQGTITFSPEQEAALRADPAAWAFFSRQPPSYRKVITWWVISAKLPATQAKRLQKLIETSAAGKRVE
ncbi:YdeI/OmpD-associated family protein [Aquincola sp. S2]|uniref:YdeI/OmpD-associated family protein n=1 Tax=Pseudaquabacterium terrae TaxID=2732868 RepID=A0ABX2EL09_9BURK|nr:YdeI/OmpD-associated family protein [Aquabacterium terrae]NRF69332.1 YdeI/OmpD-associated family protein [Aquabacterium terrae]